MAFTTIFFPKEQKKSRIIFRSFSKRVPDNIFYIILKNVFIETLRELRQTYLVTFNRGSSDKFPEEIKMKSPKKNRKRKLKKCIWKSEKLSGRILGRMFQIFTWIIGAHFPRPNSLVNLLDNFDDARIPEGICRQLSWIINEKFSQ